MAGLDLMCNVRTCRKVLTADMWVTSCSHIFCQEHGASEPSGKGKCKACDTPILKRYDIVRTHANPPEEFKSMLLAGYRPDVVLDIASRAIAFWEYQMAQEMNYQAEVTELNTLKADEVATEYRTTLSSLRKELKLTKQKCDAHVKEVDTSRRRIQELHDQLEERNKQIRMIQKKFDSLKLKTVGKTSGVVHDPPHVGVGWHNYQNHLSGNSDTNPMQPFSTLGDAPVSEQEEYSAASVNKRRDFSFQPIMDSASQKSHQFLSQPAREISKSYSRTKRSF